MTREPADGRLPCGCLNNDVGAHRGGCPDYETVYPADGSQRLEDLKWRPRTAKESA